MARSSRNINNPFNARWDYGPAGFDRRQIWVSSFIYKFPFFRNSATGPKGAAGRMGTLRHLHPSSPEPRFPSAAGPTTSGYGGGTSNRANIVAPVTYPKTRFQWFSTSSFQAAGSPAVGHFGEERRGRPGTQQLEHGDVQSVPVQ